MEFTFANAAASPGESAPRIIPVGEIIDRCTQCSAVISLLAPADDAPASPWLCGGCGSVYFAVPADASARDRSGKARRVNYDKVIDVAAVDLIGERSRVPRAALHQLVRFLNTSWTEGHEKRQEARFGVTLPVIAVPLGPDFRVIGEATQMTTVNVSKAGAALFDVKPCHATYLTLDFAPAGLFTSKAILEVLRVGSAFSAYEVAGRLRCRIAESR